MKRPYLLGLCGVLAMIGAMPVRAQVITQIDRTKQADVNGKIISPGNLNLRDVAQPVRSFSQSPLSEKRQSFSQVELKGISLQQLQLAPYSAEFVPQQNFAAKRASITEKPRDEKTVQPTKAPIKDRQIRPFTPAGEEELKRQLNEPH